MSIRSRAGGRSPGSTFLNEALPVVSALSMESPSLRTRRSSASTTAACCGLVGGTPSSSTIQQRPSVRNDYSRFFNWHGNHTAKVGGVLGFADYNVNKEFTATRSSRSAATSAGTSPHRDRTDSAIQILSANNFQFGIFAQDDWSLNSRR